MKRWLFFVYGVTCHLLFLVTFAWLACFVGNFLISKTIDSALPGSTSNVVLVNLLLLALFALQHSVMARPAFKRVWTRIIPEPIERSTYVLLSCAVTALLIWQWRGINTVVWNIEQPVARGLLWCLFAAGWLLVPFVSVLINHFDLFGSRQVWLHLRGRKYQDLPFRTPSLYKHMRHPLYVGWAISFWATPTMTVGHLLFAMVMCVYMGLATLLEEHDLISHFGRQYEEYRERVPRFVPWSRPAATNANHPATNRDLAPQQSNKRSHHFEPRTGDIT